MKRRITAIVLTVVMVLTMTAGSTAVSWAGSDMSAIESSIKAALGSYEASQTTSDGDLMFFVYELLPDDMKDKEIEIYRDRFEAATTEKDGKILFYVAIDGTLIPDEDAAPLEARIPKLPKQEDLSSPQLDEDWSLAAKAMKKLKVSNSLTKAQLLSAAKGAIKNGSKCEWKEGFYKEDATADKEGKIQGYLQLSLNGKYREVLYSEKVPMLATNMPKVISVNKEEWRVLRETNRERFKQGKSLLTMIGQLQKACDTRGKECVKYELKPHYRPDGSKFNTAIPSSFGKSNAGENLYNCSKGVAVTGQSSIFEWMNSDAHRKNLLNSKWNYIGVGIDDNVGVQIFAKRSTPIVKYTTSTGKTSFNSITAMENAYLICTDSSGRKSYIPLDTDYMKKVKGGYTIKLYSKKTVKIKVKESASEFTYSDVSSADKAAVKWAVKNKIITPLNKKEFAPDVRVTKGELFYAIHRANGSPRTGLKGIQNWFVDLKGAAPYYTAVFWAKKTGLIDYGQFSGEGTQTRGEGLYYIWKSIGSPTAKTKTTFTDFRSDVFYAKAVAWAQEKGIIKDNGDHKFGGDDHIFSRGELARYMYYAYK